MFAMVREIYMRDRISNEQMILEQDPLKRLSMTTGKSLVITRDIFFLFLFPQRVVPIARVLTGVFIDA